MPRTGAGGGRQGEKAVPTGPGLGRDPDPEVLRALPALLPNRPCIIDFSRLWPGIDFSGAIVM